MSSNVRECACTVTYAYDTCVFRAIVTVLGQNFVKPKMLDVKSTARKGQCPNNAHNPKHVSKSARVQRSAGQAIGTDSSESNR